MVIGQGDGVLRGLRVKVFNVGSGATLTGFESWLNGSFSE